MNASRFPSGPKALADYIHARGAKFGIYSDEGTETCQGYYGSQGFEDLDARTFASWGVGVRCPDAAYRFYGVDALITQVDYLKLDGCNNDAQGFATGYPAMGRALQKSGRDIVRGSWPPTSGTTNP